MKLKLSFFILLFIFAQLVEAQKAFTSVFNPQELFAQDVYSHNGNRYRSASGQPGPDYWQNQANYKLDASIDTISNQLSCAETITYINNSPDSLTSLWLQVEQNSYEVGARSHFFTGDILIDGKQPHTDGYAIEAVTTSTAGGDENVEFIITDTRMQLRLKKALPAKSTITIRINYHYVIPGEYGGRTDWYETKNGKVYEVAQWYPRMCVYDDLRGWNSLPFLGSGEFFCEYGDFEYSVTVPTGVIVAGSGGMQNEPEVMTRAQLGRLQNARQSDKTVMIRTLDETNKKKDFGKGGTKTWRFKMENTRDVAFGASAAYMWDAAKVNLPNGKPCLAMSVYPVESAGAEGWQRATEYLKKSIEYFSEKWFVYPYPVAVNEAGVAGGMEYPGIVFDGWKDDSKTLYWVTAHEIGHNWFPMIVGSDERRYAWMDEGFNTFIDIYAQDAFNNGEYAPKRDGEYAPGGGNPADEIVPLLIDPAAPPMMDRADRLPEKYRHPLVYFKPAFGMVLLREEILGPDRFDYAFKQYINRWAFRHPSHDDFFHTMESEAGEDLGWFWKEWFYKNWSLDIAVQTVKSSNDGVDIQLVNLQKMAMPFTLQIGYADGSKEEIKFPVETWLQGAERTIHFTSAKKVKSVMVDPYAKLPDSNRENNGWSGNL